ncbi:uncharacterized protein TRIADDRAFT_50333 [Trichoplax adhaerens]|uniref:Organic solute carrier partner 1 n=1 Tax=Trichoplax adhaerens TaxID=10228 RepID=B3RWJ0_TRIAD|nr:hypothetical protein TRIADDRAFT_50333 [Trichoplax adhaerens]EDV25143.1 hypothetical protein TRIADDRAFT_50333 [Trichoplax adhaerens]|eukprot:XP_002113033.1 hypothetical protein TRIADDRAFT_50333 [Trichoplax adhaerens]
MSLKTLPLLFINLGGEMVYILDQRLRAQSIPQEKARKVMHDIVGTMFNKRFMEELFKPQEMYSKKAMRTVFDRLAHASIMRLNAASMDKLYDLMTMAFKYQVSLCLRPSDVLLVTLNHVDAIKDFVSGSTKIILLIDHVYHLLHEHFASLSTGQFQLIRQALLSFFQDMHIRVSIFLKDKVQNSNGRFSLPVDSPIPYGTEMPGVIRFFASNEVVRTIEFKTNTKYRTVLKPGSFEKSGERITLLGTNMYNVDRNVETSSVSQSQSQDGASGNAPNPLAKEELNLLAHLVGKDEKKAKDVSAFRLNLFSTDKEEEIAAEKTIYRPDRVINIDASKKKASDELSRIMDDFTITSNNSATATEKGDDLLALMDSA